MIAEVHVGTMWTGKTTSLAMVDGKQVIVDFYNTRNSERDLSQLKRGGWFLKTMSEVMACPDTGDLSVLIDEVHFFSPQEMGQILSHFVQAKVLLAGLLVDCYKGFEIFPVWAVVLPFAHRVVVHHYRGLCAQCGSNVDVEYSVPCGSTRVSDEYKNVCKSCVQRHVKTCQRCGKVFDSVLSHGVLETCMRCSKQIEQENCLQHIEV